MKENNKIEETKSFEDVIKYNTERKSVLFNFRITWIAYLILAVLIGASFWIQKTVETNVNMEMEAEFEKAYQSVVTRINNQHDRLYQIIKSTQGLYYENVQVVRDYFELTGAVPVKNFPPIMCMTYAPKVIVSDLSNFQYNALSQGYMKYDLHPTANRDYYYPVEHIVVFDREKERLAFDYASLPIMKNNIEIAEADNKIVSTEFFNLRENILSFALIAPVYQRGSDYSNTENRKQNFKGSVVVEVNAKTYFENAIKGGGVEQETTSFPTDSSIVFKIIDTNTEGQENIIFKSNNYEKILGTQKSSLLNKNITINIANRKLNIDFCTVPDFKSGIQANLPLISFIVSILISFVAFFLIVILLTQKTRAEEVAERMTASQRRILDTSRDIIAVVAPDGTWLSMNPTSINLLDATPEQVIGTKITDYFYNENDYEIWNEVLNGKQEYNRYEIKIKSNKQDGFIWISWNFTKPANEDIIYVIGRDVTLEKMAADEARFRAKQTELSHCNEKKAVNSKISLMIQLSHEMRNQLTSIMGNLQMINDKEYSNEDELLNYVNEANESAESAYTYIHDIAEATIGENDTFSKMAICTIKNIVDKEIEKVNTLNVKYNDENSGNAHVIVDNDIVSEVVHYMFNILTVEDKNNQILISAKENTIEKVTEIQIEANTYKELDKLIDVYNDAPRDVMQRLKEDNEQDVLLNIAKMDTLLRMMFGEFSIDRNEENNKVYIFINLPMEMKAVYN